jgi:hypothetical protein
MEVLGRLEGRQVFLLHGVPYTRVFYTHRDDPERVLQCQLAESEFDADLAVGDPIVISYLLKTVLEIRRDTTGS